MGVSDWNRRDTVEFPLTITVEDREGYDELGLLTDFIAIMVGSTTLWVESLDDRLHWDPYGDGGPGLDEAVMDKVGEILGGLIEKSAEQ